MHACFDLVDQVLREYLDSEMVGWTGPQFAHNAPRGKPIPSCYEVKRIMAKCIISLNLYVVIFAVYIDPQLYWLKYKSNSLSERLISQKGNIFSFYRTYIYKYHVKDVPLMNFY